LWLRERGYSRSKPATARQTYLPKRVCENGFCNCGMSKEVNKDNCWYCDHPMRMKVEESVRKGQKKL